MPATATEERSNTVTVTDAGPSRKKLTIEVPAETVSEKLKDSLDTLSVETQLPGFRKGRAPRNLLERRFGSALRDEAKKQLVAQAYAKAVEDNKLKVVGDPFSDQLEKAEIAEGKALKFEVEVEVVPEFKLPSLDGIEIKKPLIEVTDAMVADELRKLCVNEGKLDQRETAEAGDYLTGRGVMTGEDGTVFYDIPGAVVQIPPADRKGKGMILGIMVDDFSKQFGLPKPGETGTVKAEGPEHHEIEKVRGSKLTITFAVDRVDRITPAETADVVRAFGFEGEDQLKEALRQRLMNRAMVEVHSAMRQQAANYLLENTQVELPQRLTAQQAARTLERQRMELMYRGVEPTVIEERLADLRAVSGRIAGQELKLFFILHQVAEELKVRVDEAEVNGRIAQLAAERNARPEALRQELIQRNQVGTVVQQVREHKTFDAIIARAKVTEVPVEEFNKAQAAASKKMKKDAPADEEKAPAAPKKKKEAADEDEKPKAAAPKKKK